MKKIIVISLIGLMIIGLMIPIILSASSSSNPENACIGKWYDEPKSAKFEIFRCSVKPASRNKRGSDLNGDDYMRNDDADEFCAQIYWLKDPVDENGVPYKDTKNKNKELRDRDILGMIFTYGFKFDSVNRRGTHRWKNGTIYNPNDGGTYDSEMIYDVDKYGKDTLIVEGKWFLFSSKQTWTRAED